MSDRAIKHVTIEDDYGHSHSYEIQQHPGREGMKLFGTLTSIAGRSAGGLRSMGFDVFVEATGRLAQLVMEEGGVELIIRILAHTKRDGQVINGGEFDSAYMGNPGEAIEAVSQVIQHNWGPMGKRFSEKITGWLDGLSNPSAKKSALQTLMSDEPNETPPASSEDSPEPSETGRSGGSSSEDSPQA